MKNVCKPKVSIIVPVYNEVNKLNFCITRVKGVLQNLGVSFEIVISEDGSTDGTDKIAYKLSHEDSAVKHLHSDVRLGRGKAIQRAFKVDRSTKEPHKLKEKLKELNAIC